MKLFAKKALIISAVVVVMAMLTVLTMMNVFAADPTGATTLDEAKHVASITVGEKTYYYETLNAAISDAASGSTVKILKDTTVTSQIKLEKTITLAADKAVTVTYSGTGSLFLFNKSVNLTVNGKDKDNCISFNITGSGVNYAIIYTINGKSATLFDVDIELNNVNVTTNVADMIASDNGIVSDISLVINNGTYTTGKKHLINQVVKRTANYTKVVSKFHITNAVLIDTSAVYGRNLKLSDAVLTNVKVTGCGSSGFFMPYSGNNGEWDITIDGGVYNFGSSNAYNKMLYGPDGVPVKITIKNNAIVAGTNPKADYAYASLFYSPKGNLRLDFSDCTILQGSELGQLITVASAANGSLKLNMSNVVYGQGTVDANGNVSAVTPLANPIYTSATYLKTVSGNFDKESALLNYLVGKGIVAKVGDKWFLDSTMAAAACEDLTKTDDLSIAGKTIPYYTDVVKVANGGTTTYYPSLEAAIDAAEEGATITILAKNLYTHPITVTKDVTITAEKEGCTIKCLSPDPLFIVTGDKKLVINGVNLDQSGSFNVSKIALILIDNATDVTTKPTIILNNVKITAQSHVIGMWAFDSINPTIEITGGEINAVGKYLLYTPHDVNTGGSRKDVTLNLDKVIINGGIYQTRVTNITGLWKNVTLDVGTGTYATVSYNGGYVQDITIVGGTYKSSKNPILYAPDNGIANFIISGAEFNVEAESPAVYFRAGRGYLSLDNCKITTNGNAITLGRVENDTTVGVAIKNTSITTGAEKPVFVCTTDTTKYHDYGFSFDKAELLEDAKKALGIEAFATTAGGHSGGYGIAGLAMLVSNGDTDTNVITVNADVAVKHQVSNEVTGYYPNVEISRPIVITSSGKYKITSAVNTLFNLTDGGELTIIGDNGLTFDLGSGNLVCARNGASAKITASNTTFTTTGVLIAATDAGDDRADLKVRFNNVDANVASVIGSGTNGDVDIIWNGGKIDSTSYTFVSSGTPYIKIQANGLDVTSKSQVFRVASDGTWNIAIHGGKYTSAGAAFYMIDGSKIESIIIDGKAELTTEGNGEANSVIYFRNSKNNDYGPVVVKDATLTAEGDGASVVFLYNGGSYKNCDIDLTLIDATLKSKANCIASNGSDENDFNSSKANIVIVNSSLTSSEAGAIKFGATEGAVDIYNSTINTATAPFAVEKIAMKLHNDASVTVDKVTVDADNKFTVGTEDIVIDASNNKITSAGMNDTDAIALGMVAKVNDTYYSNADIAAADGAALVKTIVEIGEIDFVYYTASNLAGTVAQVGNTYYVDFAKALAAVKDDDTITILADVALTAPVTVKGVLTITSNDNCTITTAIAGGPAFILEDGAALNISNVNVELGAETNLADVIEGAKATIKIDANTEINWAAGAESTDALINVKGEADVTVLGDLYIAADKYIVAFAEDAKGAIAWDKKLSSIRGGTSIPFATNENVTLDLQNFSSDAEAEAFLRGMSDEYLAAAVAEAYVKIYETIKSLYEQYVIYDETGVLDQDQALLDLIYIGNVIADVYEEAYAFGYDQAQKYGYIDLINEYLDKALLALDAADAWVLENDEYIRSAEFRAQYYASTEAARATIEELRALIANNEELSEETYEEVLALLGSLVGNLKDVNETLLIALDDAAAYLYEQLMIALNKLSEAVKEFVQGEIDKAMNEFNAFISNYVDYLDKFFPGTGDIINGWLEKYPEILLGLISKYDFKTDNFGDSAFNGEYEVNEDSYFLAIGDSSLYAELLAKKLGIYDTQIDLTDWNLIDPAKVAKADLITIGYNSNRLNGFAVDQMLGYVADYVDVDLRASASQFLELAVVQFLNSFDGLFTPEAIAEFLATIDTAANGAIDDVLENELIAGKTAAEIDWAALVGEEYAEYIAEARELLKATLIEEGITETYTYEFDIVDMMYGYIETLGEEYDILKKASKDKIREKLGEYATYTVEIPVVDAIVFSAESYLYGYVEFNAIYAQTILSIKEINPDALIVLLGSYNPINDLAITLGDTTVEIGDIYETIAATTSVHSLVYALCLNDVVYVDISDAETVYDAYVAAGAASYDIVEFIKAYLADDSIADVSEAGSNYIYEQILNALTITCAHTYDDEKDVDCNYCGEIREDIVHDCVDTDNDHKCDECEEILTECADADNDHKCDICGAALTECVDDDKDHKCDICEKVLGECADTNRDHKCDVCETVLTKCADGNRDHRCDVCGTRMTNCVDLNKDHRCDTCGTKLSSCIDRNNDHKCDTCGATLTECVDENKDHKCDVCGETATKCVDVDKDHKCDICGAVLNDCVDADKDHKCDICEEVLGECADENKDHKCDVCDKALTECADENKDHKCDVCDKVLTECADENKDHKCDVCDKALSECADANKDHKCDVCDKVLAECADANKDHKCDVCDKVLTECADENKDHKCDVCDKVLTECADENKDHKCDVCDKALTECADTDKDHKCDLCGKEGITEHDFADATCDTAKTCKICGATEGEALGHKYDNACDADCNTCGATRTPAAHTYGDWVVTKDATATEDGERQRTCECGHVEKEVIPATGEGDVGVDQPDNKLSGGAIAAIIIASVLALAAIAFVVVRVVLKKKKA